MTTTNYIFDEHQQDQELVRLRMIEELFDQTTIEHLERTGIREGWCCLELGAGAGSIMKWMGSVVGGNGSRRCTSSEVTSSKSCWMTNSIWRTAVTS